MSYFSYKERTPWWMTLIIVLCMMPVLVYPFALSSLPTESLARALVWLYPAYVIASGICAWITYPQRPEVTWILLVLLILSHAGMYFLA